MQSKDCDFSGDHACFLPGNTYLYRLSWKGISCYPHGPILMMRALYAHWFFTGGKPVTAEELGRITADVKEDLDKKRPAKIEEVKQDVLEECKQDSGEFEKLPSGAQLQLLKAVQPQDIISEEAFSTKLAGLNLQLKDGAGEVPPELRESFMAALRHCAPAKDPAAPKEDESGSAEDLKWKQELGGEHPWTVGRASSHIVDDNMWILQHMASGSERRPGGDHMEGETTDAAAIALFDQVLEALILVELVGKGKPGSRTSLVPNASLVLEACMALWLDAELDQDEVAPQFTAGRTFAGCISPQGELVKAAKKAAMEKQYRDAAVVLERNTRTAAKKQKHQAQLQHAAMRDAARIEARAKIEANNKERYNFISSEVSKHSERMTAKEGESCATNGLHPYGIGVIPVRNMASVQASVLSPEQKTGMAHSDMFFVDAREIPIDLEDLRHHIELYTECGGRGIVSVLCAPDQVAAVYVRLGESGYSDVDTPYTVECKQEATTLGTQRATDEWEVHPALLRRAQEGTPYGTPWAVILSARTKDSKPFPPDHNDLMRHPKRFNKHLHDTNPAMASATRDKYRFALDISKHCQADPEAPQCKDFPMKHALANFVWWHLTQTDGFVISCTPDPIFPLVAVHAGFAVLAFDFLEEQGGSLLDAMQTMYLLANSPGRLSR